MELHNLSNRRRVCIYCNHNQHPPFFAIDTARHHTPVGIINSGQPNQCLKSNQSIFAQHSLRHGNKALQTRSLHNPSENRNSISRIRITNLEFNIKCRIRSENQISTKFKVSNHKSHQDPQIANKTEKYQPVIIYYPLPDTTAPFNMKYIRTSQPTFQAKSNTEILAALALTSAYSWQPTPKPSRSNVHKLNEAGTIRYTCTVVSMACYLVYV